MTLPLIPCLLPFTLQLRGGVFRRKSANFGQHAFDIIFREI